MRYWNLMLNKLYLILIVLICSAISAYSQVNTSSPYSRFGLGEIQKPGFIKNLSMGSTGIALRTNNQINYLNPASYTATDTLSFLFDFGINTYKNFYISNDDKASMTNVNLHHIALSFPVTRWWKSAVGIVPYSSVGYNIKESLNIAGIGAIDNFYEGNGGLNKFFIGNAINLFDRLNIGFNLNYLFGYINYSRTVRILSDNSSAVPRSENNLDVSDLTYHFGMQYTETIKDKYFITLGATYENKTDLSTNSRIFSQIQFPGQTAQLNDSVFISTLFPIRDESAKGFISYPNNIGLGISLGIKNVLTITGDYVMQDWSNTTIMGKTDSLVNSGSMHFGAEYIPSTSSLSSYVSRIQYRLGGYYSNSYIGLRGVQINDYGMTFGVGLPFRSTKTSFNIGCILGQRGTLKNNLIKENYGIFHIGVTLHDIWFRKSKYD